jgi:hypothetical protein
VGPAALSGRAAAALVAALAVAGAGAAAARAEPACSAGPPDDPFPTCFDPGQRLVVGAEVAATTDQPAGAGAAAGSLVLGLGVRHIVATDDPSVWWRLEHVVFDARVRQGALSGVVYRGRYVRHSRDGRIVLPTSPPRKLFLPFDLGAETTVGAVDTRDDGAHLDVGVVRVGLFGDLLRSSTFRRRLALGAAARWDLSATRTAGDTTVDQHRVAPFTIAMASAHAESDTGLTIADLDLEGGRTWTTTEGWRPAAAAHASLERVLIAFDDRPVSLYAQAAWSDPGPAASLAIGLRVGLLASPAPPR